MKLALPFYSLTGTALRAAWHYATQVNAFYIHVGRTIVPI